MHPLRTVYPLTTGGLIRVGRLLLYQVISYFVLLRAYCLTHSEDSLKSIGRPHLPSILVTEVLSKPLLSRRRVPNISFAQSCYIHFSRRQTFQPRSYESGDTATPR